MNLGEQKMLGIPVNKMRLYCSACRRNYSNMSDWAKHLVKRFHQVRSRHSLACGEWGTPAEKPNILIAYSERTPFAPTNPKVKMGNLFAIQFLSHLAWTCKFVPADFVWTPKFPKLALVRFPVERAAEDVLKGWPGRNATFSMSHVSFKKATEFPDLAWNLLMDHGVISSLTSVEEILNLK